MPGHSQAARRDRARSHTRGCRSISCARDNLFYTIYFVPPLVVAVAAKLADARLDPLRAWLTWPRVLLFIVAGTAGIYNAFFSIVVLCFTALAAAVAWREKRRLAHGIAAASDRGGGARCVPTLAPERESTSQSPARGAIPQVSTTNRGRERDLRAQGSPSSVLRT
jgi:hypothetical protein